MQTFAQFEDIEAWRLARTLTKEIYSITASAAIKKDYALCDQIRRAAVSIQANIAEGSDRDGRREFIRFLLIARGSAGELRSYLYTAMDTNLLSQMDFSGLYDRAYRISRVLTGLIVYLRGCESRRSG